jgi:hypothetical protein
VLVKQGKINNGLVKYDEALKCASNWAALKVAREEAAKPRSQLDFLEADAREGQQRGQSGRSVIPDRAMAKRRV